MKLEYRAIKNAGDLNRERVVLKARDSGDIGTHIVFRAIEQDDDALDNDIEVPFWVPDKQVKENDLVVLYSKAGTDTESENKNGTVSHFFYMGHKQPIWASPRAFIVVVEGGRWQMQKVREVDEGESDELVEKPAAFGEHSR